MLCRRGLASAILAPALLLLAGPARAALAPSFEQVRAAHRSSDWLIADRHGAPLQRLRQDETVRKLGWVRLEHVSPALQATLLAAEDKRFYEHGGVDWAAAAQAAWDNLKGQLGPRVKGAVPRGASTLSMQLAALLDPALRPAARQRRDFGQKWNQAQAAWEIERHWRKGEIFEAYLNLLPLRGETVGIAAASEVWFGKTADGLDLAEAALLSALIRQPQASPARAGERACGIVAALDADTLPLLPRPSCAELKARALATLQRPLAGSLAASLAPHAGQRAAAEWQSAGRPAVPVAADGVPTLRTTLDAALQRFARERLDQQLRELAGRNVEDGAVLVLDNASGEILAWVGSSGTLSAAAEVDGVTAPRQAGSTLKPFLYGLAIEQRLLTAASLLDDSPVALTAENGLYVPQNYDRQFRGWVSVRTALASSLNIPAVRTLLLTGSEPFYERLKTFGFGTLSENADYYGLALALGGAEVRLLDLANAYRALANGGRWAPTAPLIRGGTETATKIAATTKATAVATAKAMPAARAKARVTTNGGRSASVPPADAHKPGAPAQSDRPAGGATDRRALSPAAAYIVGDILADRGARAPTFGLENALATRVWAAVKTGTSKDMRDNWAVGYTGRYTVAVWVGNFSGAPMWNVSGVHGAAPLWRDLVHFLHDPNESGVPSRQPAPPAGLESVAIRFADLAEAPRREWFLSGTAMPVVTRAGADAETAAVPRIVYPAEGLIVALDPDIPLPLERLPLTMQPLRDDYRWQLERLGEAPCRIDPAGAAWAPSPGRWRLSLRDPAGATVEAVNFSVRGSPRHPAPCTGGAVEIADPAIDSAPPEN